MIYRKSMVLFFSFLFVLNGLFIGLELYKENVRNQWASHQMIANKAFLELDKLNDWTVVIESTLSISIFVIGVWLIFTKNIFLKYFFIVSAWTQLFFLIIGLLLAIYFEIAILNLVQQLLGPSFILGVLGIFLVIRSFCVRLISDKNMLS